jgi:hypothetical protein
MLPAERQVRISKVIVTKRRSIANTFQGGEADGFIAEMNGGGTAMVRGTYLGTPSVDQIYGFKKTKVASYM